jgi:hypothetical protein
MAAKIVYDPVAEARKYTYVREVAQNKGQRVKGFQSWCGGLPGDSWCCEFATFILDVCFQGDSPVPRLQACQDVLDLARKNGWVTDHPIAGDLFLYINPSGHAHHIGFVTKDGGGVGIAGNTSADGTSDNGDRVAEHSITTNPSKVIYVSYPRN